MKKRKLLRRFALPILLIGLGIFIGTSIVDSNQPTIQVYRDIGHQMPRSEYAADMHELERELDEMMRELERELDLALPEIPEIPAIPQQQVHVVESTHGPQANVGRISLIMGGLGILAIIVMSMIPLGADRPTARPS